MWCNWIQCNITKFSKTTVSLFAHTFHGAVRVLSRTTAWHLLQWIWLRGLPEEPLVVGNISRGKDSTSCRSDRRLRRGSLVTSSWEVGWPPVPVLVLGWNPTHGAAADGEAAIPSWATFCRCWKELACAFKQLIHAYLRMDMHTHTLLTHIWTWTTWNNWKVT